MRAFPSTLSAFCSGNVALSEVLNVLRADLSRDRKSIPDNMSLVDQAWRSGKVGEVAYRALRDTITGFDVDARDEPQGAQQQHDWTPIRATRRPTSNEFSLDTDREGSTRIRSFSQPISVASNRATVFSTSRTFPAQRFRIKR